MKKSVLAKKEPVAAEVVAPTVPDQPKLLYTAILLAQAILAFIGAQLIGPFVVGVAVLAGGVKSDDLVKFMDSPPMRFVLILAIELITITGISMLVKHRKWTWKDIGLGHKPNWKDLWRGSLVYVIYFVIFILVYSLEKATGLVNTEQVQKLGFDNVASTMLPFVFISLVILPPIAEEIVFRGFIFKGLRKRLPYIQGALITSVLFAIAHLEFGNGGPLNWAAAIDTFTLSMLLTYATERYKSIWPAMIAHALKNGIAFTLLYLVK